MGSALDDVTFLARSANRVRVLDALVEERRTRHELEELTGVPRATLGRILADFEGRGWAIRTGGGYRATTKGVLLAAAFRNLLDTIRTLERFDDLIKWFPVEEVMFDIRALREARVTTPSQLNTLDPITRFVTLIEGAERVRLLGAQHTPPTFEAMWVATVEEGRQRTELVLTAPLIDAMLARSPDRTYLRDLVACGRADVYRIDGDIGYTCASVDGIVVFSLSDTHGASQALVESDDSAIHMWFETSFARHRHEATLLEPGSLTA